MKHSDHSSLKKTKIALFFFLAILLVTTGGCGRKYMFRSEPADASLYLNDTFIGKTPIEVPVGDLPPTPNIKVRATKDGHIPFTAVLPGTGVSTLSSEVFITLTRGEDETDKLNRNIGRILNAQKLVLGQRYPEALKLADEALEENPRYVYAQLLKASILFLNKQYTPSMKEYQKVLEIDPSNTEAIRMINYLKSTGGTMPENAKDILQKGTK